MLGHSHALSGGVAGLGMGILLHLATTGTRPELLIVDPVLSGALLVLAGWLADPTFVAAHWHSLIGQRSRLP